VGSLPPEGIGAMSASVTIVIPCFNEAHRLQPESVKALRAEAGCDVLLVDDGSRDDTASLLASIAAADSGIDVLCLPRNHGKAEAVRTGLLAAIDRGADVVGFADADFATPPAEIARLVRRCIDEQRPVVIGSRVDLLGHDITRNELRHYTGRVFGTMSSLVLGFSVYDTQCGAKVFMVSPALARALGQPFVGRWSFDVELLGRLASGGTDGFVEVPLLEWHEVGKSKLGLAGSVRATAELLLVRRALRRFRSATSRRDR
jgi:glycosyltransferase involved in cell wall biosynthesis